MKITKKVISYLLVSLMAFSSFTILPSEFWGWADVSAVELATEESNTVKADEVDDSTEKISKITTNTAKNSLGEGTEEPTYIEGDFIYSIINENEVKIVGQNGVRTNLVIPSVTTGKQSPELANKKVTAIGDSAFTGKNLTAVTFGKNLVTIGNNAFYQNKKLLHVDLSVCTGLKTIGDYAFYNCEKLSSATFPDSVETIGDYAFYNCDYITNIETGSQIKRIGEKAFYYIGSLKTVNIKGGQNAIIGQSAFEGCGITQVTIGDGVEILDTYSFANCYYLKKIDIGNTVTTIKTYAIEIGDDDTDIIIGTGLTTVEKRGIFSHEDYSYDDTHIAEARIYIYSTKLANYANEGFFT